MAAISASTLKQLMVKKQTDSTETITDRHNKVDQIMKQELDMLINKYLIMKDKNLEANDFKLCSFFRPLCIKDDYGKQHLIKRQKCYTWLPNTDPETEAVTYAELLLGVYSVATGKVHPERLPEGKTLIQLFNQWLSDQHQPFTCIVFTRVCKRYQRVTDGKYSTMFNLIMIKDLEQYLDQHKH